MNVLRALLLAAAFGAALAAPAQVRYAFSGTFRDNSGTVTDAFTFVTPAFVAANTGFGANQLTAVSTSLYTIGGVSVYVSDPATPNSELFAVSHTMPPLYPGTSITGYGLPHGALSTYGTYAVNSPNATGTLTVSAVPEPATLAALGLGAAALLRRRRRA